ncbi:MAG: molybdopterin molybdotransferase MoeA [Eubacteriales bacterium]|nr:molybdopterin molybdotransferase MoeA [Eubacteriales bacterium]
MKERSNITIWEATDLVCQHAYQMGVESLPIMESLGRILAEDVYTKIAQPPFPRSAMDGYALKASDTIGASEENPVVLKVVGSQFAGNPYFRTLEKGEALRIMTGAAIPEGADAVIRQEDSNYGEDTVELYATVNPFDNYCPIGEDFPLGDCLAKAGDVVDAYLIAAAVAAGIDHLLVRKRVCAAVITTGDELQKPGSQLAEGKIYNSNLALFSTRLMQLGCDVKMAVAAGDSLSLIREAIEIAAESCDLIITTGGVSVGQKDLLPEVMEKLGAETIFHGIAIKPGMPTMFSLYGKIPVISLSGNPYSASAVFELLTQPLLAKMTERNKEVLRKVYGVAKDDFGKKSHCMRFLRGYYEDGKMTFSKGQSNGQTKAGIGANCLICLDAGHGSVAEGDRLEAYLL